MAAEKEELLARPLVFRAIVAPVVTRSPSNAALGLRGRPCVIHPLELWLQWGVGEGKEKASQTGANCRDKKILVKVLP